MDPNYNDTDQIYMIMFYQSDNAGNIKRSKEFKQNLFEKYTVM